MFARTLNGVLVTVVSASVLTLGIGLDADAGPRGRVSARTSINRPHPPNVQRAQHVPVQRNTAVASQSRLAAGHNINSGNRVRQNNSVHNVNIDNHRDVNIDVDGRGRWGYDDHYHPIATAAAVTATVAVTSAVVGAILTPTQMPPDCVQVMRYNTVYMQCGSTWFQPQYQGSNVTYVVVNAP